MRLNGSFTALVFFNRGMSGCTNIFYKRLAYLFSWTTVWYDSVVASASHFCDQLLPVYRKHYLIVVVRPTMMQLTWLWLRVKCVIKLIIGPSTLISRARGGAWKGVQEK